MELWQARCLPYHPTIFIAGKMPALQSNKIENPKPIDTIAELKSRSG